MAGNNTKIINKSGPKGPSKYDEEMVGKLETVYQLGVSDEIACQYAGISKTTLYEWRERIEGLADRLDNAKHYARIAAGAVVVQAIKNKDVNTAKWWLEKKYPQEFGTPTVQLNQQFNGQKIEIEIVEDTSSLPEDKNEQ